MSDWISLQDAAKLMKQNEKYLRVRNADQYKYWPELRRFQPRGPRTAIWLDREEILAWIRRVEEAAARVAVPLPVPGSIAQDAQLAATLRTLGARRSAAILQGLR